MSTQTTDQPKKDQSWVFFRNFIKSQSKTDLIYLFVLISFLLFALIIKPDAFINGLPLGATYALVAVGYSMVYGILKLINFAHGEIFMLGAYFTWAFLMPGYKIDDGQTVILYQQVIVTSIFLGVIGSVVTFRWIPKRFGLKRYMMILPSTIVFGLIGFLLSYVHIHFVFAVILSIISIGMLGVAVDTLAYRSLRESNRLILLITAIGMSIFLVNITQIGYSAENRSYGVHPKTGESLVPGFLQVKKRITDTAVRDDLIKRKILVEKKSRNPFTGELELKPIKAQPRADLKVITQLSWWEVLTITHKVRLWTNMYLTPREMIMMLMSVLCLVCLHFLVMKTKLGMMMRACSTDLYAARLMGINVEFVIGATFFIGSGFAALAGALYSLPPQQMMPTMGFQMGIIAFSAAVMGGIGDLKGAALGGLILGIVENFISGLQSELDTVIAKVFPNLPDEWVSALELGKWSLAIVFTVLILTVLIKPKGLMNVKTGDRA